MQTESSQGLRAKETTGSGWTKSSTIGFFVAVASLPALAIKMFVNQKERELSLSVKSHVF